MSPVLSIPESFGHAGRSKFFAHGAVLIVVILVLAIVVVPNTNASSLVSHSTISPAAIKSPFNGVGMGNETGPGPYTIQGNCVSGCNDELTTTSSAQHTFTGAITSESGYQWEKTYTETNYATNDYALVLSTTQVSCSVYGGTQCAEQWFYLYQAGTAYLGIQQWIFGASSCTLPFQLVGGACIDAYQTSALGSGFAVGPGSLSGVSLQGYAASGGDWVKFCASSSSCTSQYSMTDYISIYNSWTKAAFNMAGDPSVSGANPIATFNAGTSVTVTDTAGSGTVGSATADFINEAVDFNIASASPSGSTLTYTENNLPNVFALSTSIGSCLPSATCVAYANYCTGATSCSVKATVSTGDLVFVGFQAPSGTTVVASDTLIDFSCGTIYYTCQYFVNNPGYATVNGESSGLGWAFDTVVGGSTDTFTVTTSGTAGTIGIEVAQTNNGIAYIKLSSTNYVSQTYSGTASGCASATHICINSGTTPTNSVNLAVASIYAYPASGGVTVNPPYLPFCGTQNAARCIIFASDLPTTSATQFPATDTATGGASYWSDAGWVWNA